MNFRLALISFSAIVLASCNGTDQQTNPQPQLPARNGVVSFRIDNINWEAPATFSSGILTAYRGQEMLQIQLPTYDQGTYNISSSAIPSVRLSGFNGQNYDSYGCSPFGGRVVISAYDGSTVTGTFNARVCSNGENKEIINGVFTRIQAQ